MSDMTWGDILFQFPQEIPITIEEIDELLLLLETLKTEKDFTDKRKLQRMKELVSKLSSYLFIL